jgi:hypothetical protein
VTIGAYGRGALPRIDASGDDAVTLTDVSHAVVQDLELTNRGDYSKPKRGVHLIAKTRLVTDVIVRGLRIHDVDGDYSKGRNGSGGIQIETTGPPPARFARLRILDNDLEDVARSGISMVGTLDPNRPGADRPWPAASRDVIIARNRIDNVGGDGIVPRGTVGAIISDNVVSNGNLRGRALIDPRGAVCDAGIWAFHANGTVIRRNEVFGMRYQLCDGTGFDIDYDQDATIVEFNYSHDNGGGFILLCGETKLPRRAEVRFNLSLDDATTMNEVPCKLTDTGELGTLDGVRFYNNTIVAKRPNLSADLIPLPILAGSGDFLFANNLVYATQQQFLPIPCGEHCSNNLFFGLPSSGTGALTADPQFVDPTKRGQGRVAVGEGFQPTQGSPARGAGKPVPNGPATDFFGTPLTAPAPIGFSQ